MQEKAGLQIKTGTLSNEQTLPSVKLACVMVGLPARGKTYIARKVARYLTWLGHRARIFNVGNYRRDAVGAVQPSEFFNPDNAEFTQRRTEVALLALDDMIRWLEELGDDGTSVGSLNHLPQFDQPRQSPSDHSRTPTSPSRNSPANATGSIVSGETGRGPACVALYDATNSTLDRRQLIEQKCRERGIAVMFIESICNDVDTVMANIREVKLSSPDYKGIDPDKAIDDFQRRIAYYAKSYDTLTREELDGTISFVKLIDVGDQVLVHKVRGYIQSRIVYFLMNLNTTPRSFFFSRHGESLFNVQQRIGGDTSLSPRGQLFARKLPEVILQNLASDTLTIWTSTLKRTMETAQLLKFPKMQWKQLDELDSGVCDGLTYEEIEQRFPNDFLERDLDKFNYRYHSGESYRDLVNRLEPVILELERHREAKHSILIIGHQAVLRCIYAYFLNIPHEELPYIKVPLHTVVKLTPKAYGCEEVRFAVDVPAVDTHRERPEILSPRQQVSPEKTHSNSLSNLTHQ